jgi:hypothetical protein
MSADDTRESETAQALIEQAKRNRAAWDKFVDDTLPVVRRLKIPEIPEVSDNFAVIIEPRIHRHLEYVLRNVMHFLGEGWGLQVFAGQSNARFISEIVKDWGYVHLFTLDFANLTRRQFRNLRKTAAFWREIPGENLLCFEVDSILCRPGIDEFLGYDYVGAPWHEYFSPSPRVRVGNGGLSLRRRSTMIEICEPIIVDRIESEDCFFAIHLQLNADRYKVAPVDVARRFSVETMYHPSPLGFHKAWDYLTESEFQSILDSISY